MLAEIIIYIGLFAALFSGAFCAAFQTVDMVGHLQEQKEVLDELYFFSACLDSFVWSNSNWQNISLDDIIRSIPDSGLSIESLSSQIFDTATSSNRVLFLTLGINKNGINKKTYTFSYVQEK